MAISLTSDGLNLNYPTSTVSTYESFPRGCAVIFQGTRYETTSAGTWAFLEYDDASLGSSPYRFNVGPINVGKGMMTFGIRVV